MTITELTGLGGVSARTGEAALGTSQLPSAITGGEAHAVRLPSELRLLHKGQVDLCMDVAVHSLPGGAAMGIRETAWAVTGSAGPRGVPGVLARGGTTRGTDAGAIRTGIGGVGGGVTVVNDSCGGSTTGTLGE